ncbi:hypothetical protein [Ekhidna sp. To15]|uniref:hypothetical protein n=1 Tax=Ekhidna sp. To15 TaxID=3395267 RepID=UPI003F52554F
MDIFKRIFALMSVSIMLIALIGCPSSSGNNSIPIPPNFKTTATICTTYPTFTYASPATITNQSIPDWLTLTGNTLDGEPEGQDFGVFPIWVEGKYNGKTGRASSKITVAPPVIVPAGTVDITINSTSGTVAVNVTPACVYTLELRATSNSTMQRFSVASTEDTDSAGSATIGVSIETDAAATGTLEIKITPNPQGGAQPVVVQVPINAHH